MWLFFMFIFIFVSVFQSISGSYILGASSCYLLKCWKRVVFSFCFFKLLKCIASAVMKN
jgi:hypothetical protein